MSGRSLSSDHDKETPEHVGMCQHRVPPQNDNAFRLVSGARLFGYSLGVPFLRVGFKGTEPLSPGIPRNRVPSARIPNSGAYPTQSSAGENGAVFSEFYMGVSFSRLPCNRWLSF